MTKARTSDIREAGYGPDAIRFAARPRYFSLSTDTAVRRLPVAVVVG